MDPDSKELGANGFATQSGPSSIVITLVHGTWAPAARWTMPHSFLRDQLVEQLALRQVDNVQFCRFVWSGRNSHPARRSASVALRKQLLAQVRTFPQARHFVVAHSHGGNVALRAVSRSCRLRQAVGGIVSVATPFLSFSSSGIRLALVRPTLTNAVVLLPSMILAGVAILAGLGPLLIAIFLARSIANFLLSPRVARWMARTRFAKLTMIAPLLVAPAFVLWCLWAGWGSARDEHGAKLRRRSLRLIARYRCDSLGPNCSGVPVLALSSLIDEAYGVLIGSWWAHRLAKLVVEAGILAALVLAAGLSASIAHGMWLRWLSDSSSTGWRDILHYHLVGLEIGLTILLALVLARIFVSAFLAFWERSSPGLGFDAPEDNLICDTRASRSLPASVDNRRYSSWDLLLRTRGMLFHSRIYGHAPAVRDIAGWIRAHCEVISGESKADAPRPTEVAFNLPPGR